MDPERDPQDRLQRAYFYLEYAAMLLREAGQAAVAQQVTRLAALVDPHADTPRH